MTLATNATLHLHPASIPYIYTRIMVAANGNLSLLDAQLLIFDDCRRLLSSNKGSSVVGATHNNWRRQPLVVVVTIRYQQ